MPESAIEVRNLAKSFRVPERESGVRSAVHSLFHRTVRTVTAVEDLTFDVQAGEVLGVLGPNGAGKTTTIKMLSGLLHPSSGEVRVLGFEPHRRETAYLRQISLVMGNRRSLDWDIPAVDSYELNRSIYGIARSEFVRTRDELVELFEIGELVRKPVRNLSLGERMKAEIVGSLLHRPAILFLDEPTIGLDVTMQARLREFLTAYNQHHGSTVILTSHYMADVTALAKRVLVIHHGSLIFDGPLRQLVERFATSRTLEVTLQAPADLSAYGEVISVEGPTARLRIDKAETARITARLLADREVVDLTVEDPPVEEIIDRLFRAGMTTAP